MRYQFTRVSAHCLVVTGAILMAVGIVSALAVAIVGLPSEALARISTREGVPVRAIVVVVAASSGLLLGGALIVAGQLVLVFLDQRQLLIAQYRLLRRIRQGLALRNGGGLGGAEPSRPEPGRPLERLRPRM